MAKLIIVGISDQKIASEPDTLITYALGSCVGICIYDKLLKIGGLAHILLPESFNKNQSKSIYKFADTAIEALVTAIERLGSLRYNLTAKIAGGANMFTTTSEKSIGERNVEIVKNELQRLNIKLLAEDTGLNYGRTVMLDPKDGSVTVKTTGKGIKIL